MPFVSALPGPVPAGPRPVPRNTHERLDLDTRSPGSLCQPGQILIEKQRFAIRVLDERHARTVESLVERKYRQRGYLFPDAGAQRCAPTPTRVTLEALRGRTTVGTLTIGVGAGEGIGAEALYGEEIAPYRRRGRRPAEFTRLAMSLDEADKEALAAIFHIGIVVAYRVLGADDLFIEVNPRHVPFYLRKIGFRIAGPERTCPRVNAPAVLMHKDLAVCSEELSRLGGLRVPQNRTFYAFALTPEEERQVLEKLFDEPLRMAS